MEINEKAFRAAEYILAANGMCEGDCRQFLEAYEAAKAPANGQPDDCRKAFEEWATKEGWIIDTFDDPESVAGHYISPLVRNAWKGWCGLWNSRLPEREVVASEFTDEDGTHILYKKNWYLSERSKQEEAKDDESAADDSRASEIKNFADLLIREIRQRISYLVCDYPLRDNSDFYEVIKIVKALLEIEDDRRRGRDD